MKGRRLDRKIQLQRRAAGRDAFNAPQAGDAGWDTVFSARARRYPAPGTEKYVEVQERASMPVIFEVLPSAQMAEVTPAWRLLCDGQAYGIKAVDQATRQARVRLVAIADL